MGSKTRLSSYCTKRGENTVNLVTSRKTIARLARPIHGAVIDHGIRTCNYHTELSRVITNQQSSFQHFEGGSGFFTMLIHITTQGGGGGQSNMNIN